MSLLIFISNLQSPCLGPLGFLRITDNTYSCSWSYVFSWYFLTSSPDLSYLDSLTGSIYGKNLTLLHIFIFYVLQILGRSLFWFPQDILQIIYYQWYWHCVKFGVHPIYMLVEHHVGWYLLHNGLFFLTFIFGLPRPLQKVKRWIQYYHGVSFSSTM